jgi:hypothetical protein
MKIKIDNNEHKDLEYVAKCKKIRNRAKRGEKKGGKK